MSETGEVTVADIITEIDSARLTWEAWKPEAARLILALFAAHRDAEVEALRSRVDALAGLLKSARAESATLFEAVSNLRARAKSAERGRDEARTAARTLHGLVESACLYWRGAMPALQENESLVVAQDRLTEHDLIRKADATLQAIIPLLTPAEAPSDG